MMRHIRRLPPSDQRERRHGSLYVAVLLVGAIVSVLGLSALTVSRISIRSQRAVSDSTQARMNAHAAIRLGMLDIESDPDWRFARTTDTWYENIPLGNGTFDLTATDPSDGDLADAAADPLLLTGIGRSGDSVHRTQITLAPLYRGYECLGSAIHAADDLRFYDAEVTSDHVLSANDDISASNSQVAADVESVGTASGQTFTGLVTTDVQPRTMPADEDVLEFYTTHGTWIDLSDIPNHFADIVRNGDFSDGRNFWSEHNATLLINNREAFLADHYLRITDRRESTSGVTQDVKSLLISGRTYDIELSVACSQTTTVYVHLETQDSNGLHDIVSDPISLVGNGEWVAGVVSLQPWLSDSVTSARLVINTSPEASSTGSGGGGGVQSSGAEAQPDLFVDQVRMREQGTVRAIDQILLSPANNPFGAPDPQGIYVIDLRGNRLVVRNSRIHGTLVLIDPAADTEFGGEAGLAMSAAVASFPTLLVSGGRFSINPSTVGLSETAMQVNLNPPDAPWSGVGSDNEIDDTFASGITGMIYSSHRVSISNVLVSGTIVSGHDVHISDEFSISWDNRFYRNPPPGFSAPEQIRILLGSAKRVAN